MSDKVSFNLTMLNLFIGLVRGHRFLHPFSDRVRELGYQLFRIEPSFVSNGHRVNPDAMAFSRKSHHTLLAEWTSLQSPNTDKMEQVQRYLRVTGQELVDLAAVPPDCAQASGVWLTVTQDAEEAFEKALDPAHLGRLVLSSLHLDGAHTPRLAYRCGRVQDDGLTQVIGADISATRIPYGYVQVSTDSLATEDLVEPVVLEVVSFAARARREFDLEDICFRLFQVWPSLDVGKRRAVMTAVRRVMNEITRRKYCSRWLQRTSQSPPRWAITCGEGRTRASFLAEVTRTSRRLIGEVGGGAYQLELFDEGPGGEGDGATSPAGHASDLA